jgi:ketosteroid isomerase-like protein
MADRAAILAAIDEVYRLRIRGDKPAMQALFAPGARIQLAGAAELMPGVATGPADAAPTIAALIDTFVFHEHERLDAIVEGDKAAVRSRVKVSRPDGEIVTTELYDLWTIGEDGKPTSVLQFVDTALVARLMASAEAASA